MTQPAAINPTSAHTDGARRPALPPLPAAAPGTRRRGVITADTAVITTAAALITAAPTAAGNRSHQRHEPNPPTAPAAADEQIPAAVDRSRKRRRKGVYSSFSLKINGS